MTNYIGEQETQADAVTEDAAALARRGDISEILLQFRAESPVNIIRALAANVSQRVPAEKTDGNTQARINGIYARTATEGDEIALSFTIDPPLDLEIPAHPRAEADEIKQARHEGRKAEAVTPTHAYGRHGGVEAYPGEDADRQDIIDQAREQAQEAVASTMQALDEVRIPYVVSAENAGNKASVTISVNARSFEKVLAALREVKDIPSFDTTQKEELATAFWQSRDERPKQENGQTGKRQSDENRRRADFPELAIKR